ncbi:MAG: hypothetical protein AAF824_17840 [Bacteroidota bacterium]
MKVTPTENQSSVIPQQLEPNELASILSRIRDVLQETGANFHGEALEIIYTSYKDLAQQMRVILEANIPHLLDTSGGPAQTREKLIKLLDDLRLLQEEFSQDHLPIVRNYLHKSIGTLLNQLQELVQNTEREKKRDLSKEELISLPGDSQRQKQIKARIRLLSGAGIGRQAISVKFRELLRFRFQYTYLPNFHSFLHALSIGGFEIAKNLMNSLTSSYYALEIQTSGTVEKNHELIIKAIAEDIQAFETFLDEQQAYFFLFIQQLNVRFCDLIHKDFYKVDINQFVKENLNSRSGIFQEVKQFAAIWYTNQDLFHKSMSTQIVLLKSITYQKKLAREVKQGMDLVLFSGAESNIKLIQQQMEELRKWIKQETYENIQSLVFKTEDILIMNDYQFMEGYVQDTLRELSSLKSTVDLIPTFVLNEFLSGKRKVVESMSLSLQDEVFYLMETHFHGPVSASLTQLPQKFKQIYFQVQDSTRLISFNLPEIKYENPESLKRLEEVLKKAQFDIDKAEKQIYDLKMGIEKVIEDSLQKTIDHLAPHIIAQHVEELRRASRNRERIRGIKKYWLALTNWWEKRYERIQSFLGQTREDILLSEFELAQKANQNTFSLIREFTEKVQPDPEVLAQLPFYYRQLFVGNQFTSSSLINNRNRELVLAQKTARRMKQKVGGAMLVIGEAYSGMSYFCENMATQLFEGPIYRILPPLHGSIRPVDFTRAFQRQIGQKGNVSDLIESTPFNSVFLLHDIELWWERTPQGYEIIYQLVDLIQRYSFDYHFILNCNTHAFQLIKQVTDWESAFLNTIQLSPFSEEQIRRTILSRHYSGGLDLMYQDLPEKEINATEWETLFKKYKLISDGNIGVALRMWLKNIEKVKNHTLYIKDPEELQMPAIEEKEWLVVLSQFVFHKQLSSLQLTRIFPNEEKARVNLWVQDLIRANLLIRLNKITIGINPYLYPYIINSLKKAQLLNA